MPISSSRVPGPCATLTETRVRKASLTLPGHVTHLSNSGRMSQWKPQVNHTAVRASYLAHTQVSLLTRN